MKRSVVLLATVLAASGCDMLGGGGGGGSAAGPKVAESGTKRGSAGGFSATLSAELGKQNVEPASIAAPPPGKAATAPSAGSATTASAGSAPAAGSTPAAGTKQAANNDETQPATPETKGSTPETKGSTPVASAEAQIASANTPGGVKPATTAAGQAPAIDTKPAGANAPKGGGALDNRTYVKPSAELAAIKLDLEPNWDRDFGEPGTFSLVVKLPNSNDTRVFAARYGYEDQAAPVDCDAYRTYLQDKKILSVTLDRQRGAACYIEGTDGSGTAMFRYLLTYGGRRLMCTGSLYKDQASLGDLRDKVLMQAKKICETLAL